MLIGRLVFVYRNGEGFNNPLPGVVVAERKGGLVDVNVFNSALSNSPPMLALANVTFCETAKKATASMESDDVLDLCGPYDPADPQPFIHEKAPRTPK